MASTSASVVQRRFEYDVFISFRGEEINFVDDLDVALKKCGIKTYKGYERIDKRRKISDHDLISIEEYSRFHIIVISKNYASSSWCLDELVKIMKCQSQNTMEQTAYPVFYDVERAKLRDQSGKYGEAFVEHDNEEAAERWRDALRKASNPDLVGWEWNSTFYGHEAKFIHRIVEEIYLKPHFINKSLGKDLVGMETRVKEIASSLETSFDDVRMIGIKGIGGGGKTTLARAVYDHISIWFDCKTFVENVTERSKGSGLRGLQKQILSDVLNDNSIVLDSVFNGLNIMKRTMSSRKVLLVLDDVDHIDQLEAVAGELTWFKSGSRIIITTRDEYVLVAHGLHSDNIHDVHLLSNEEASRLFCRRAFKKEVPVQGYEEQLRKVVSYAHGLPLTIKNLSYFFEGKKECEWEDAIGRLKTNPLKETLEILQISYDGLENDDKEIFLEVACILKGEEKGLAIRVLESLGYYAKIGLALLKEESLLTISDDGCLRLQKNMEEMGQNIVRRLHPWKPRYHSRLWVKEEIEQVLINKLGTKSIRAIKLEGSDLQPSIIMKGLRKMKELRSLYVNDGYIRWEIDDVSPYLPDTLQNLIWYRYPFLCLPETFEGNNLVNLEMPLSKISQLWERGERKVLDKLRFLNLSGSKLSNFDFGLTPCLEELYLRECNDFEELRASFECTCLRSLILGCPKMTELNLRLMPNLEELHLLECNDSVKLNLPVELPKLTVLNKEMKHLPISICRLKHLKYLDLKSCLLLEQLPQDLDTFECLEELYLTNCISLRDIPSSICNIKCLKSLRLTYCMKVKKLPEDLGRLKCLKELNLEGAGVRHLPQTILQLKGLHIVGSRGRLESYGLTSLKDVSSYTASCYI